MELKVTKEKISSAEIIFSETNEQSVELDYILPDYLPEIFKILKCIAIPNITSYDISNDKLNYEMTVCIRVLYCSENSNAVQVIEQNLAYSKKIDIDRSCLNPDISITPHINYINCRAVNQRRIDIRGAVSTDITISDMVANEFITDVNGGNIYLKKTSVTYPSDYIKNNKILTISEEFDLGTSKPPIINIIRSKAVITSNDKKVIANKLIVKGEICVNMLYTYCNDNCDGIETMQFTMPFSQVIDMEGVDERFISSVDMNIISCDIIPRSNGDGISERIECDVKINIISSAYRIVTSDLAIDEYSTMYTTTDERIGVKIEVPPKTINNTCVIKSTLKSSDEEIDCVYDAWCTITRFTVNNDTENKCIVINGNANYCIIGKDTDGNPVICENEEPFTAEITADNVSDSSITNIKLIPVSCSYNLSVNSCVEIKAELKVIGYIKDVITVQGITDVYLNEDLPLEKNHKYALKIYYTDKNEDLWEIAKKYGTSVNAIIEENEIEDNNITNNGMLLIPIV